MNKLLNDICNDLEDKKIISEENLKILFKFSLKDHPALKEDIGTKFFKLDNLNQVIQYHKNLFLISKISNEDFF